MFRKELRRGLGEKITTLCLRLRTASVIIALSTTLVYSNTYTVSNTNDTGSGSLREAITNANINAGPDIIAFSVSGTIAPTSALPPLTDNGTVITAASRWSGTWPDGSPGDTLNGSSAGNVVSGFTINGADYCEIRGICIKGFKQSGVYVHNGAQNNIIGGTGNGERNVISNNNEHGIYIGGTNTNYNVIKGNYIGTHANGTQSWSNNEGVEVAAGAQSNTVGGSNSGEGNVISGNTGYAVEIEGSNTTNNIVKGNYIGTDKNGTAAVANGSGFEIADGAQNNTIGGSTAGERNIISGNTNYGIEIYGSTTRENAVKGNYIGTNAGGTGALRNNNAGVYIYNQTKKNTIGGSSTGEGNVISGNTAIYGIYIAGSGTDSNAVKGNYIGTDASGTAQLANGYGVCIDSAAKNNIIGGLSAGERNIISGNTYYGIWLQSTNTWYNTVKGNYIGADKNGTAKVPNGYGIFISNSTQSDTIGGSDSNARNIISGNTNSGIFIGGSFTRYNSIKNNYIGTDVTGNTELDNTHGIEVVGAQNNTIGGSTGSDRNTISGNKQDGIHIAGTNAQNNSIIGNFIGTKANGTQALANWNGISIENGATSNTIGGSTASEKNIVSGNTNAGVVLGSDLGGAYSNSIKGNYIGTDTSGTVKVGNGTGVNIFKGSQSNVLGGPAAGEGNIISGNTGNGIYIGDDGTKNNIVRGNYIGTDVNGTNNLSNGSSGIYISNGAQNDTIGGGATGQGNIIAFNGADGITIVGQTTCRLRISGNSFFSNTGLGIDLIDNGVTPNDNIYNSADPDSGIDFPVTDTLTLNVTTLHAAGFVGTSRSTAETNSTFANCRVEIYKAQPDPTTYGEGKIYLGYLTTGSSNSVFSGYLDVSGKGVSANDSITCLTIDANSNTSEFGTDTSATPTGIVISSFSAEAEDKRVAVHWETEAEVNVAGFNLYRSLNESADYTKLTESLIPAKADPVAGATYVFNDSEGRAGNYYKLEVVNLSGGSIFYGPIKAETKGIEEKPKGPKPVPFAVLPNPVRTRATIQYYVPSIRTVSLKIFDSSGRQVCQVVNETQKSGNYYAPWVTEKVQTGVYFISLNIQGEKVKIKKAVIIR